MQPGRRGGCASAGIRTGINGLVALAVFGAVLQRVGPSDVGWQRTVSQLFHQRKKIGDWVKAQGSFPKSTASNDLRGQLRQGYGIGRGLNVSVPKIDLFSHSDFSSRTHQRLPLR